MASRNGIDQHRSLSSYYLSHGKRTGERTLSLDVLFITAFLAHRMPTKQPEIRGSLKGKKRVVFLPLPVGQGGIPLTIRPRGPINTVPLHDANRRHNAMQFTPGWGIARQRPHSIMLVLPRQP